MKKKRKITIISIPLIITILASIYQAPFEGLYYSEGNRVLMEDHRGYVYFRDNTVYAIDIDLNSKKNDTIVILGTYQEIEKNRYFIDTGTYEVDHFISKKYFRIKWDEEFTDELLINDHIFNGLKIINPFTIRRIKRQLKDAQI